MALLAVLFSPVKGRKEMLREYCVAPTAILTSKDKDNWTVLDSDGEDDEGAFVAEAPLRENDYVDIFNQFPLIP